MLILLSFRTRKANRSNLNEVLSDIINIILKKDGFVMKNLPVKYL